MSLFGRKQDAREQLSQLAEDHGRLERAIADLQNEDVNARASAVDVLAEIGDARAVEPMLPLLRDTEEGMLLALAEAFKKIGDSAVGPLLATLQQEDPKLRKEAAWILGYFEDARVIEPLAAALQDQHADVRREAAAALAQHGDQRGADLLLTVLVEGDVNARGQAARALARLGDQRAVEPLIDALKDDDEANVRVWAATALGELGAQGAVEQLITALASKDWTMRMQAAIALGKIGDRRAVEPLAALADDESVGVKTAARDAQGKIREAVGPAEHEELQSSIPGPRCAVCGRDLTGQPAMRDNVTGAVYCSEHPPF